MNNHYSKPNLHRNQQSMGFTLVEMMVTITVLCVLLTIAVPTYQKFTSTQRIKFATFDLMSDLMLARNEAIKRNTSISLSVISSGLCWKDGWKILNGTTALSVHSAIDGVSIVDSVNTSTNCSNIPVLTYNSAGRLSSSVIIFTIDPSPSTTSVDSRCISVDYTGRARSYLKSGGSC
jgi:type IV fimbrial biogenesis protein FimT